MASQSRRQVVVVGAGLAGLGAAWRAVREGCEVTVVERRPRAGGRIAGRSEDGYSIDASLQMVTPAASKLVAFVNELGLSDRMLPLRPVRLAQIHQGEARSIDPGTLSGVARIPGVHWRDMPKLLRFERLMGRYQPRLDPAAPERAEDLDYRSVADFARLYFGETVFQHWIGPAAASATQGDEYELSRVAFLLSHVAAGGRMPRIARQGLHELVRHASEQLAVRTRVAVSEVSARASGDGYTVRCRGEQGEEILEADAVVLAVGAGEASRIAPSLLEPAERDFLGGVVYSPSILLSIALDRPLTGVPVQVRVPHVERSGIEVHLVEPGSAEGRSPTGCGLLTAVGTEAFSRSHLSAGGEVVEKAFRADLDRWYPRLDEVVRFARLERREDAVPQFRVGAYRALARFRRVQADRRGLRRRLYFAGDYLAGASPEAAHVSGERAARDLLADLS